jgi:hypothetical protein
VTSSVQASNGGVGRNPNDIVSQQCGMAFVACLLYSAGIYFCGPVSMGVLGCLNRWTASR